MATPAACYANASTIARGSVSCIAIAISRSPSAAAAQGTRDMYGGGGGIGKPFLTGALQAPYIGELQRVYRWIADWVGNIATG